MTSTGSSDPLRKPTAREYYPWWLDKLADDVTGEGAAMQGVLHGAENVRRLVLDARALYEHQEFEFTNEPATNAVGTPALRAWLKQNSEEHRGLPTRTD